ncbi:iron-containing alcohol dehydrogenase, partial [Rhizobium leguminosarum]
FDTPHAETHAVMLPHTAAFNAGAAAAELSQAAAIFGGSIGGGLWDFSKQIGAPMSLKDFGRTGADLDRAASIAVENPYWNPRPR